MQLRNLGVLIVDGIHRSSRGALLTTPANARHQLCSSPCPPRVHHSHLPAAAHFVSVSPRIPTTDLLGVTALLLTCSYRGKEFVRVGYYVNVEYTDPELLDPERPPPHPPLLHKLQRSIMAEHPRVTKFPHDFDNTPAALPAPGEGEPEPEDDLLPEEDGEEEEEEDDDDEEEEDEGEEGEEEPDSEYEADVFEEELGEEQQQQQQAQRELGDVQMGTPGGGVAAAGGRTLQRTLQPGGDGDMDLENVAPAGHPSAAVAHEGKLAVQTAPQQPLLSHTEDVDMDACS